MPIHCENCGWGMIYHRGWARYICPKCGAWESDEDAWDAADQLKQQDEEEDDNGFVVSISKRIKKFS